MGGGGVQRWLKHVKYIRNFGWEPVIYTAKNPETGLYDESLLADIPVGIETIKGEIFEPYNFYKILLGKKKNEKVYSGFIQDKKPSFSQKLSMWIRSNVFIPDARMFWIKPSVKLLSKYLKNNHVDAMVSTGPPHTTHLIALKLKQKFGIKWLADFRDPWTQIDYFHQLDLTNWAEKKHKTLEQKVIHSADQCVTVSWSWANDFEKISGKKFKVVTNGYDPDDFKEKDNYKISEKFTITHIGSLNSDRNPFSFWEALANLKKEISGFESHLEVIQLGPVDSQVLESVKSYGLEKNYKQFKGAPHKEALELMMKSQILLLPLNNTPNIGGVVPGKLYEYLGANRPIIAIGKPDADSGKILKMTNAGKISDFGDVSGAQESVYYYYQAFLKGKLEAETENIEQFSRKNGINQILEIIESI